jgi:polar amino acid transport system substrate-binding protein
VKWLKKTVFLLLLSALTVYALSKLVIVVEFWPPYDYYIPSKKGIIPMGVNTGVVVNVLKQMGVESEVLFMPWERCLKMVKNGNADAIISASKTPEREKYLLYPDEPLSYSKNVIFMKKGSNYKTFDDIKGLKLAYVPSYYYGGLFDKLPVIKVPVNDTTNGFLMLKSGRVDLVISDYLFGIYEIKALGMENEVEIFPIAVTDRDPLYIAFSKARVDKEFVKKFSEQLKDFKKTEEYRNLIDIYSKDLGIYLGDIR